MEPKEVYKFEFNIPSFQGCLLELCHRQGYHGPGGETHLYPESKVVQGMELNPQCDVVVGWKFVRQCHLRRIHPNNFPNGDLKVKSIRLLTMQQRIRSHYTPPQQSPITYLSSTQLQLPRRPVHCYVTIDEACGMGTRVAKI